MVDLRTTEELLNAHKRWTYVRTDKNGTRYFHDYTCGRCGGRGGWEGWPGFTCYECGGTGKSKPYTIKVYTPEHEAKLAAQRQARAEKRQKEREAKALLERPQKLFEAGFGKEDETYVIYRIKGETFSIKEQLKELGCKFKPGIGWFAPSALDGYDCQRLEESQVLDDTPFIQWKDKDDLEKLCEVDIEPSPSEWQGEVGERIDIKVHIDRQIKGVGYMGKTSYLYLMSDENKNVYKWSSSCFYMEGDDVHFRATVKDHSEYKGIHQTVLTRCTKVKGA